MSQGGTLCSSEVAFVSFSRVVEGNFTGPTAGCTKDHLNAAASAGTIVTSGFVPPASATGSNGKPAELLLAIPWEPLMRWGCLLPRVYTD